MTPDHARRHYELVRLVDRYVAEGARMGALQSRGVVNLDGKRNLAALAARGDLAGDLDRERIAAYHRVARPS